MLKSIFDLPTSKDQLEAANSGFSSWKWLQKAPLRNIQDEDANVRFSNGVITYRWDMASSTYFMPSKCFLHMRCQLTKSDNSTQLDQNDGIAPSMGLIANLMIEASVTINDQQISICERHVGEIEAMYTRLNKSGQWMRDIGNSVNFWEADLKKRIQEVSSNGQLSEVVGDNHVEIKTRVQLGVAATVTVAVAAATHILTFAGVGAAGTTQNFKSGDIIVLNIPADAGFQRAFYVVSILTNTTMQLASFGTTLGANIAAAAGANDFSRYRYGPANVIDYVVIDAATTQVASNVNNLLTANAGTFQGLNPGDVAALALNGTTIHNAQIITENVTTTTALGSSFNPSMAVAAGAANPYPILRYKNIELTNAADLGYIQSTAAANGHAVDIAINAGGNALLTIRALGNASAPPNVRDNFKVGDIVTIKYNDGAVTTGQAFVIEVDPSNNNRSLGVIGSQVLAAATGLNTDARNYLFQRVRLNGAGENKLSNKARQLKEFEINWTPRCLSFFRLPHSMPGGAKYELNLTPKNL